jgi:hypothetical protein
VTDPRPDLAVVELEHDPGDGVRRADAAADHPRALGALDAWFNRASLTLAEELFSTGSGVDDLALGVIAAPKTRIPRLSGTFPRLQMRTRPLEVRRTGHAAPSSPCGGLGRHGRSA